MIYLACAVGVFLSILIPVLSRAVQKELQAQYGVQAEGKALAPAKPPLWRRALKVAALIWPHAQPYVFLAVLSLAIALLLVAYLGDTLADWKAALLAGYACDSTLQKIAGRP